MCIIHISFMFGNLLKIGKQSREFIMFCCILRSIFWVGANNKVSTAGDFGHLLSVPTWWSCPFPAGVLDKKKHVFFHLFIWLEV